MDRPALAWFRLSSTLSFATGTADRDSTRMTIPSATSFASHNRVEILPLRIARDFVQRKFSSLFSYRCSSRALIYGTILNHHVKLLALDTIIDRADTESFGEFLDSTFVTCISIDLLSPQEDSLEGSAFRHILSY